MHYIQSLSLIPIRVITAYTLVNKSTDSGRSIAYFYCQIGPSSLCVTLPSKLTEPSNRNTRKVYKRTQQYLYLLVESREITFSVRHDTLFTAYNEVRFEVAK